MEDRNVYDRARRVVREIVPLLHAIREQDKSLADQLKRAAQSVVLISRRLGGMMPGMRGRDSRRRAARPKRFGRR